MKIYRAFGAQVTVNVVIGKKNVRIPFHPVSGYQAGKKGSAFETDDSVLQEVLEKSPEFGRVYHLVDAVGTILDHMAGKENEKKVEELTKPVDEEKNLKEIPDVSNLSDAKIWLEENKGWKSASRPTRAIIDSVAKSYGVCFPGLKKK